MAHIIYEGEESIAVGSTGTLLSLIGKEMVILQARKSCSVDSATSNAYLYEGRGSSKLLRSPLVNWESRDHYKYTRNGYSASPAFTGYAPDPMLGSATTRANSPSRSNIVSSLWTDLKGLIRSPTNPRHQWNAAAASHRQYHNSGLFVCRDIDEDDEEQALQLALFDKRPAAILTGQRRTCPKEKYPAVDVADLRSRSAESKHSHAGIYIAGAPDQRSRFTVPPAAHEQAISCYRNRKAVDGTAHAAASPISSASSSWSRPENSCCIDISASESAHHTRRGKLLQAAKAEREIDNAGSRKSNCSLIVSSAARRRSEQREVLSATALMCRWHKERGGRRRSTKRHEERELCDPYCSWCSTQEEEDDDTDELLCPCAYNGNHHPLHSNDVEYAMRRPLMLRLHQPAEEPFTPASSPNCRLQATGRSCKLAAVNVVDLQCCHTTTSSPGTSVRLFNNTPSARRLSFTRLSHS